MLYTKVYFLLAWFAVALAFILYRPTKKDPRFAPLFPSYFHYSISLLAALVVGVLYNADYQVYCHPVGWVKWVFGGLVIWLLVRPLLPVNNWFCLALSGFSACVALYLLVFGSVELIGFMVMNGMVFLPLAVLGRLMRIRKKMPFEFLYFFGLTASLPYWLLYASLPRLSCLRGRDWAALLSFPVLIFCFSAGVSFRMDQILQTLESPDDRTTNLEEFTSNTIDRYLLERMLGAHWKYHTRICLYDGWRPPFHDPVLVMGRTMSGSWAGLSRFTNSGNLALYQQAFPEHSLQFDCKCAKYERWPETYMDWEWSDLWSDTQK